jgi:hypothetical protein
MENFLGDSSWWVKDFGYMYCNVITKSPSLNCNGVCVREDDG